MRAVQIYSFLSPLSSLPPRPPFLVRPSPLAYSQLEFGSPSLLRAKIRAAREELLKLPSLVREEGDGEEEVLQCTKGIWSVRRALREGDRK